MNELLTFLTIGFEIKEFRFFAGNGGDQFLGNLQQLVLVVGTLFGLLNEPGGIVLGF